MANPVATLKRTAAEATPIYGTMLDGENIYDAELCDHGVIVMGNEGKGVSKEVQAEVEHNLFIPPWPADRRGSESLNVAIATAIVCENFRRPKWFSAHIVGLIEKKVEIRAKKL